MHLQTFLKLACFSLNCPFNIEKGLIDTTCLPAVTFQMLLGTVRIQTLKTQCSLIESPHTHTMAVLYN